MSIRPMAKALMLSDAAAQRVHDTEVEINDQPQRHVARSRLRNIGRKRRLHHAERHVEDFHYGRHGLDGFEGATDSGPKF